MLIRSNPIREAGEAGRPGARWPRRSAESYDEPTEAPAAQDSRWWLAGGGLKPGSVSGAIDEFGFAPAEKTRVHDLHVTAIDAVLSRRAWQSPPGPARLR